MNLFQRISKCRSKEFTSFARDFPTDMIDNIFFFSAIGNTVPIRYDALIAIFNALLTQRMRKIVTSSGEIPK